MRRLTFILIPPLLSAGVLAGMVMENATRVSPRDAEGFHARVKNEVEAFPAWIKSNDPAIGNWASQKHEVARSAIKLLQPNALVARRYTNVSGGGSLIVDLLIDQCKDAGDMLGHYPPNCYPAHGEVMVRVAEKSWRVGNLGISGTEYEFEYREGGTMRRRTVYNFFIVPEVRKYNGKIAPGGIVKDMKEVIKAAADYEQRYYGVAQFQMVMASEIPAARRDAIFEAFLAQRPQILHVLLKGGDSQ